jgi:hypothetical protein
MNVPEDALHVVNVASVATLAHTSRLTNEEFRKAGKFGSASGFAGSPILESFKKAKLFEVLTKLKLFDIRSR